MLINNQLVLDQIPGCFAWKDANLKYAGANKGLLHALNMRHQEEIIGHDDFELARNTDELNKFFYGQDLLVLSGQSIEIIHEMEHLKTNAKYHLQKSPLCGTQGQIIGIIYQCTVLRQENLFQSLKQVDKKFQTTINAHSYYTLNTDNNPAGLSNRELECLFLQLRGKTAKQIAEILALSKRTIESYLDNIKTKLGCLTKSELLVVAMAKGYYHFVPKSLLKLDLPELLKL